MKRQEVYATANKTAKEKGYKLVFPIKSFVQTYMPHARNIDGAKWVVRNNRCPELVLFICPNELTAKVKSGINAWDRKGIETILVQPKKFRPYTPTAKEASMFYDYGDTDSKMRMIASIWAPALGYTFEYPLYRTRQDEIPDPYMRQSSIYADVDPDKLTKYSTKSETYLESKRAIVSEEELKKFMEFYKAVRSSNIPIEEFLDPDYKICPECGRPYRTSQSSSAVCPRCDHEEEDIEVTSYWDDRGEEPEFAPSYNAFDIGIDFANTYCGIPTGKLENTTIGSTTFTATDYTETWKWYNTWE